ncbi:hypothetical protein NWF32_11465 [Pseudomonas qingdaonensis]|nr:hypothetical protein [Pseudomonas qingdaonensis]
MFTYFSSKEVLFQELYLHLKQSLVTAMMSDFPPRPTTAGAWSTSSIAMSAGA